MKLLAFEAVARLTRFEGRGHKKMSKGSLPPLLLFFKKIFKKNYRRGKYWLLSPFPPRFDEGAWPPGPPPFR